MTEYIEQEALLSEIERREALMIGDKLISIDAMKSFIKNRPTADVAPVRHGRWIIKHKHRGGFHRYTGINDMGEQHTITVDERVEYDDRYCSECGKQSADNFLTYCPNCGARMDLED